MAQIIIDESAAPSTPSSGKVTIYAKTDGLVYGKDDAGTETRISNTNALTSGTPVASTSGTSIDFTSIPSGVKRITIMFLGVSTSGTSNPIFQLGDAGGVETTGYASTGTYAGGTNNAGNATYTSGFGLVLAAAANLISGHIVIENISSNNWVAIGQFSTDSGAYVYHTTGDKSLSAELDRVRCTTVGGTDTFDAGTINIFYE